MDGWMGLLCVRFVCVVTFDQTREPKGQRRGRLEGREGVRKGVSGARFGDLKEDVNPAVLDELFSKVRVLFEVRIAADGQQKRREGKRQRG